MPSKQDEAKGQQRVQEPQAGVQRILLVGQVSSLAPHLSHRFPEWRTQFWFASTCEEACELLRQQSYDLVLSEFRLPGGWASRMIPHLEGTPASLFCMQIVEAGCWWIPLVRAGRKCDLAPALRRSEFFELLREQIEHSGALRASGQPSAGVTMGYFEFTSSSGRKEPIREQCC